MSAPLITDLPYKLRLDEAVNWSLEHPRESFPTSVCIYQVSKKSIQSRVLYVRRISSTRESGGHNRILTAQQAVAIIQYCREAAQYTVSATRDMVMAAVSHLRAQEHPLKPPPSKR
jgi:hypothetical protein